MVSGQQAGAGRREGHGPLSWSQASLQRTGRWPIVSGGGCKNLVTCVRGPQSHRPGSEAHISPRHVAAMEPFCWLRMLPHKISFTSPCGCVRVRECMAGEGDERLQSNRMVRSGPRIVQPLTLNSNTLPDVYSPASLAGTWGEGRRMTPPLPASSQQGACTEKCSRQPCACRRCGHGPLRLVTSSNFPKGRAEPSSPAAPSPPAWKCLGILSSGRGQDGGRMLRGEDS